MICSICIATYKRPGLLRRLLESIKEQVLPEDVRLQVIVVDNDAHGSAEEIVRECGSDYRLSFSYWIQPLKNISLTRNVSVQRALGSYILFIDDDEVASPGWVSSHLKAVVEYDADGIFGPVVPEFCQDTPEWLKRCYLFSNSHTATPTGSKAEARWSGNCLLKASILRDEIGPFDPRYGLTGGEDTHLFDRLEHKGAKFVYCQGAWVSEYVPAGRTRPSHLLKVAFRGGNAHARRVIEFSGRKAPLLRLFMLAKGLAFGLISVLFAILTLPSRTLQMYWKMKLASNLGRLFSVLGWHYRAYK